MAKAMSQQQLKSVKSKLTTVKTKASPVKVQKKAAESVKNQKLDAQSQTQEDVQNVTVVVKDHKLEAEKTTKTKPSLKTVSNPKVFDKEDILRKVAKETRFPLKHVRLIVDEALGQIQQGLKTGHDVRLMFFGKFRVKKVSGGFVQHVQTKQRLAYAPSTTIGFKPSQTLKRKIKTTKKAA
jgi:nucleoid DNA-binding protein